MVKPETPAFFRDRTIRITNVLRTILKNGNSKSPLQIVD